MNFPKWLIPVILIALVSCKAKNRLITPEFDEHVSSVKAHPDTLMPGENPIKQIFPDSSLLTSTVEYCEVRDEQKRFYCSADFDCIAYIDKSGTLNIRIAKGNGYTAYGVIITYKDRKSYCKPFTWTHIDFDNKPVPEIEIKQESLTLDKTKYTRGDSLFGKIYLHAVMTEYGERTEHFVQGYFRCKIDPRMDPRDKKN